MLICWTPQRPLAVMRLSRNGSIAIGRVACRVRPWSVEPPVFEMVKVASMISPGRTGSGFTSMARFSGGSVAVGVLDGDGVWVIVGGTVAVNVDVAVAVNVRVVVTVGVAVRLGVAVRVGVAVVVDDAVGVADTVGVLVTVAVSAGVGVRVTVAVAGTEVGVKRRTSIAVCTVGSWLAVVVARVAAASGLRPAKFTLASAARMMSMSSRRLVSLNDVRPFRLMMRAIASEYGSVPRLSRMTPPVAGPKTSVR